MSTKPSRAPDFLSGQLIRRLDTGAIGRFVALDYPQKEGDGFGVRGDWYSLSEPNGPMTFESVPAVNVKDATKGRWKTSLDPKPREE